MSLALNVTLQLLRAKTMAEAVGAVAMAYATAGKGRKFDLRHCLYF